jgi:hypothetical protein
VELNGLDCKATNSPISRKYQWLTSYPVSKMEKFELAKNLLSDDFFL